MYFPNPVKTLSILFILAVIVDNVFRKNFPSLSVLSSKFKTNAEVEGLFFLPDLALSRLIGRTGVEEVSTDSF